MNPTNVKLPDIPSQGNWMMAQREQAEALLKILRLGQKDIAAGNYHDAARFFDEPDGESAD